MRKKVGVFSLGVVFALGGGAFSASKVMGAPVPVWEFNFNDVQSGVDAINTGSDPNAANAFLAMSNYGTSGTDADHRVQGGPSGKANDYSFSTVRTSSALPYAVVPVSQVGGITGFNQITVTGWYNLADALPTGASAGFARTFLWGNRDNHVFSEGMVVDFNPQGKNTNQLGFEVNDYYSPHFGGDAYAPVADDTGRWVYYAITYDGTQQTNNVSIYVGDTSTHVHLAGTATLGHNAMTNPDGTIFNVGGDFVLGADAGSGYQNGVIGQQDDIRIFKGLVPLSDMDVIRESDVVGTLTPGDMNGDGVVNQADANSFFEALSNPNQFATDFPGINPTAVGDINGDGKLDFSDLAPMLNLIHGGTSPAALAAPALRAFAVVPEPTSLALLALGLPIVAMRRRK